MPKLVLKRKAEIIDEFNMKSAQSSCTIGADKFNNIVINDKLVSATHTTIERRTKGYYVRDMNSAFGTYLNGQRVQDTGPLKNGDSIQVGNHTIHYQDQSQEIEWTIAEPESHTVESAPAFSAVRNISLETQPDFLNQAAANSRLFTAVTSEKSDGSDWAPYYLVAIYGPYQGKRYQLRYGETKIGRDENLNDIILQQNARGEADQSISRRHATINYQSNSFLVRDKRSKTRTHVNQIVVPVDEDVEIFPGDELEIVSDQQSSIFRLLADGKSDFSPPKKAGVWWVRYQAHFKRCAAILAVLAGGLLLVNGLLERSMLTQKPNPFAINLTEWITDESEISHPPGITVATEPFAHPAVAADCNGDGFVDIITATITNKPILIDGASRLPKWMIDTIPADPQTPFITGDLNQDEIADLVYVSNDGRLTAIDGLYGAEIWSSPFAHAQLVGPPAIDDFNDDGLNDIAIADTYGKLHLGYNRVADMEWLTIETEVALLCPLSTADINHDGFPDLLCGSERGLILVIDGRDGKITGTIDINEELNRARGTFFEDNQIRHPIGVADLNGDGQPDYVINSLQGRMIAINGATKTRLWYDVFTDEITLSDGKLFPLVLGHFDDDGLMDVVTCTSLGDIRAYKGAGDDQQPALLWQYFPGKPLEAFPDLTAADVNKDGITDVTFRENSGELKILDGRTGKELYKSEPILAGAISAPLAADFGKDGMLDVGLVNRDGIVYQFQTNSRIPESSVLWGQKFGQHNNALVPAYRLPPTFKADVAMALGMLMFIGTGVATVWTRRRRRRYQ